MLWSACYPCRSYRLSSTVWIRQHPRFFRFPVRFAGRLAVSNGFRQCTSGASMLAHPGFILAAPEVVSTRSWTRLAQSSRWDSFQARYRLCLQVGGCSSLRPYGSNSTPRSHASWSGFHVAINPGALTSLRQASDLSLPGACPFLDGFSLHSSWYDHRPVSNCSVETLQCVFWIRTPLLPGL